VSGIRDITHDSRFCMKFWCLRLKITVGIQEMGLKIAVKDCWDFAYVVWFVICPALMRRRQTHDKTRRAMWWRRRLPGLVTGGPGPAGGTGREREGRGRWPGPIGCNWAWRPVGERLSLAAAADGHDDNSVPTATKSLSKSCDDWSAPCHDSLTDSLTINLPPPSPPADYTHTHTHTHTQH